MDKDNKIVWVQLVGDDKPLLVEEILINYNAIMMPDDIQPAAGLRRVWFGNTCIHDADNPDSVPYTVEYDE